MKNLLRVENEWTTSGSIMGEWENAHYVSLLSSTDYDGVLDPESQEAALAAYEQAIQLLPRGAVLYYHKGQVLEQLGREGEARQAYEEARRLGYNA